MAIDPSTFLPAPRIIDCGDGTYTIEPSALVLLDVPDPQAALFTGRRLLVTLSGAGLQCELTAARTVPAEQVGITLRVDAAAGCHRNGYLLDITDQGVVVTARSGAGLFYGVCTLIQLIESGEGERTGDRALGLPCLHIADHPDYSVRGVMLDISRDKVPTMETLLAIVDMLAGWKVNQLQLYVEHTFAYRNHPEAWAGCSPITGEEILALDAYCRDRHIELVPNQNSAGHLHHWLGLERYRSLAETHGMFDTPWGEPMQGPFSLCPVDPGSLSLVRSMYDELLPHFSSRQFNAGLDETVDVGQGRSREACGAHGHGRVYLDFLLAVYRDVTARGRILQYWGDVIVNHPDLVPELPKDAVALLWGYEANHPFDAQAAAFAAAGVPFYVCPGTSSWCTIAGRTDNAIGNLLNAAENGLRHGAEGLLNTDWGDRGHWQTFPVSLLGLAFGAAISWSLDANRNLDLPAILDRHAFHDRAEVMGRVSYDLGNVYRALGIEPHNSSVLFWVLQWPLEKICQFGAIPDEIIANTRIAIERAAAPLERACMERPDASLILREFRLTAHMLRHACDRATLAGTVDANGAAALRRRLHADLHELIAEYRAVWLERNRPGGLDDSVARLRAADADYV